MRVERFVVHTVHLPLREPFETSVEREVDRTFLVVEAHADGLVGYGEVAVSATAFYYPESVPTAREALRAHLAPRLLGVELADAADAAARLAPVRGWNLSKAGLEGALLDLSARAAGEPLWRHLGGQRPRVACGTSIGKQPDLDALLARVDAAVADGARRVKVKVGPGEALGPLAAVRARHPSLCLAADANEAFTPATEGELRALERLDLQMLEQPFGARRFGDSARLARRLRTPLCLDDGVEGADDLELARELGALGALNVKAPRMGGWLAARDAAAWCAERAIPAFCGGLLDSGIGKSFHLALATCRGLCWPADATPSRHRFERDLVDPPIEMADGVWTAPEGPGIGVEVDRERFDPASALVLSA